MADLFTGATAQITPFSFGAHAVRVIDRDGSPWFVAKDVCDTLGYSNSRSAVADHLDDDERSTVANPDGRNGGGSLTIINESGLYALVLRSRKPEARKFAKWVTAEVLPAIRKTGGYQQPTHIAAAMDAANAVAAQVQRAVFEKLLAGGPSAHYQRWMLTLDGADSAPRVHAIEHEAVVMSLPRLAVAIVEPNGMLPSNTELANLAAACNQRLATRLQRQSKKEVTA